MIFCFSSPPHVFSLPHLFPHYSSSLLFADDAKCYKTIHNPLDRRLLQSDLDLLTDWSHANHLIFKTSKCNLVSFKSNSRAVVGDPYIINGCEVSKKTPIVILVSFFLRTCHGQATIIILSLRPTGLLAYLDVLLDIHTPLRPRKSYIFT